MTHYEEKCNICDDLLHSYNHSHGYGDYSYNHIKHKVYEERRIETPEGCDATLLICIDCSDNYSKIREIVHKRRSGWYEKKIESTKKEFNSIDNKIDELKEKKVNLKSDIYDLMIKKNNIKMETE